MITPGRPESAVHWARAFIQPALKNGSKVVDATAGNGNDTLFLAVNTGDEGIVYAFDIQEEALEETGKKITEAGLSSKVKLILGGHEDMERYVPISLDAVMFNLGYLPGSNKKVITKPETTLKGIKASLKLLKPGGRVSIVVYTGHPGSIEESAEVSKELAAISEKEFSVQKMIFWNSRKESPQIYFVTKSGEII
ncbi:MAG: class I SAM-dependent methyltransferase [Bacillota bacterium]